MRWDGGVFLMALSGEIRRRRGIRIGLAHAGEKPGERDFRSPLLFPPPSFAAEFFCLGEGPPVAGKKWREEIPTKKRWCPERECVGGGGQSFAHAVLNLRRIRDGQEQSDGRDQEERSRYTTAREKECVCLFLSDAVSLPLQPFLSPL